MTAKAPFRPYTTRMRSFTLFWKACTVQDSDEMDSLANCGHLQTNQGSGPTSGAVRLCVQPQQRAHLCTAGRTQVNNNYMKMSAYKRTRKNVRVHRIVVVRCAEAPVLWLAPDMRRDRELFCDTLSKMSTTIVENGFWGQPQVVETA